MTRLAFKMQLIKGNEEEYQRRHESIWPELASLLNVVGIADYSIFLDEDTGELFGYLLSSDPVKMDDLPKHPVMKKWWDHMKDIMDVNPDNSPVSIPLREVFHLD